MTVSPASCPLGVPRLRDERHQLPFADLPYNQWARDRKAFWKLKQQQADDLLDATPLRRVFEERIALVEILGYSKTGGVYV